MLGTHAAHDQQRAHDHPEHDRGSEIRLLHDEGGEHEEDRDHRPPRAWVVEAIGALGQHLGPAHEQRELGDLTGLHLQRSEDEPALRPRHQLSAHLFAEPRNRGVPVLRLCQPALDVFAGEAALRDEQWHHKPPVFSRDLAQPAIAPSA